MLMSLAEDRWFRMETSIKFHNLLSIQDGAEYYDPPGGLLSFDMNISEYLEPGLLKVSTTCKDSYMLSALCLACSIIELMRLFLYNMLNP
jgi:hypothetical protein